MCTSDISGNLNVPLVVSLIKVYLLDTHAIDLADSTPIPLAGTATGTWETIKKNVWNKTSIQKKEYVYCPLTSVSPKHFNCIGRGDDSLNPILQME